MGKLRINQLIIQKRRFILRPVIIADNGIDSYMYHRLWQHTQEKTGVDVDAIIATLPKSP